MKGNLATLIRLVRRGLLPPLPRLDTRTSLVGVEDLCRAARLVATHADAAGRTFLVSDGMEYRLLEIEAAIYQALGRTPPRLRPPRLLWWGAAAGAELVSRFRPGQVTPGLRAYRNLVTDSVNAADRLDETFGYQPRETFYTALPGLVGIK
jgi:nucleoside-diphosphate-sugar epimerase